MWLCTLRVNKYRGGVIAVHARVPLPLRRAPAEQPTLLQHANGTEAAGGATAKEGLKSHCLGGTVETMARW